MEMGLAAGSSWLAATCVESHINVQDISMSFTGKTHLIQTNMPEDQPINRVM